MKLVVLDNYNRVYKEIEGSYKDGVFHYKEGFFDKEKTLNYPYDCLIPTKKEKIGIARYNGKDYIPLSFTDVKIDQSIKDFLMAQHIADLTLDSQLSKPAMSFKEILQLGVMVFMIIAIIGEYYVVQQQHAATLAYIKPLNASINQNNVLIHVLQNQTKALDKLLGLNITK